MLLMIIALLRVVALFRDQLLQTLVWLLLNRVLRLVLDPSLCGQKRRAPKQDEDEQDREDVSDGPQFAVTQQRQQEEDQGDAARNRHRAPQSRKMLQQLEERQEIPLGPGRIVGPRI